MNADIFTKLLKNIDQEKLKNIYRRLQITKFRVRGFNDLEKIPLSLVGGTLSSQKKSALIFLTEVCKEYETDKLTEQTHLNFEHITEKMTSENSIGIIAYLLLNFPSREIDILEIIKEMPDNYPAKKKADKAISTDASQKKEERFRQKYLEQLASNKSLNKDLIEANNQLLVLQRDVSQKNAKIQELLRNLANTDNELRNEKRVNQALNDQLLKINEELRLSQQETKKKKALALCSDSINDIENSFYKIFYYDKTNIDELRGLCIDISEIWLINSETISPSFARKIYKDATISKKIKQFDTPADLIKYVKLEK